MSSTKRPWRKVLYEKQPYPDNYTDKKMFLRDLRKNIDVRDVSFLEAFGGAVLLVQEFCTVVAFATVYFYLVEGWAEPAFVLSWTTYLTIVCFLYYLWVFSDSVKEKLGHDLRTVLTFIVFGQLFAPVLYTLTDTISTDTIYTTTFFMMLVHLIFFDYGVSAAIVSNSLSLSAAVFSSICLASRLASAYQAFILMTVATEAFVLFPMFRKEVGRPFVVTTFLFAGNSYYLYRFSLVGVTLFVVTVFFIQVVCPVLFVRYQRHKDNIYGPWDEAVVDDAERI